LAQSVTSCDAAIWSLSSRSGHRADIVIRSLLTLSDRLPPSIDALQKVHSITSSAGNEQGLRHGEAERLRGLEVEY
jgi:hypothetical protein